MKRFFFLLLVPFVLLTCADESEKDIRPPEPGPDRTDSIAAVYFPPAATSSWEVVEPAALGWNQTYLQEAIDFAREKNTYSLLIVHRGRILSENYWHNSGVSTRHHVESVSKSVVALLVGILQERNELRITQPVSDFLDDGWSGAPVEQERAITIHDLLTMTSGLDDDLRFVTPRGEQWYYNHVAFTKLFEVIDVVREGRGREAFDELIFRPVGIADYSWEGLQLSMTARDMARFGLLILNHGEWEGVPLISRDGYFQDMLETSQPMQKAYGYLWWLNGQADYLNLTPSDAADVIPGSIYPAMPDDAILARGHFDQRIEVIPSLDLIVIRQGGDTRLPELGPESFDNEFWTLLMKAIQHTSAG